MIPFEKYLVFQCPTCGCWQGKQNNKWTPGMSETGRAHALNKLNLKCISCRKTTKFKNNEKGGVRTKHYWADHPHKATAIIQELKKGKHV